MKPGENTRICAVTRERLGKEVLLRFVAAPHGCLVFDMTEKLPGRGIWVKADRNILAEALSKKMILKAARGRANRLDAIDADAVVVRLKEYLGRLLQLAAKSGLVTFGADSIKTRQREGGRFALIVDGRDFPLDAPAIGALFGREKSGHLGIEASGLASKIQIVANKIKGLETA